MRMMSFALTERQLLDGTKTVTRRTGWQNLRPGDRLLAVRKAMGLKKGEKIQALCEIEVVSVRREMLCRMEDEDCAREGFPQFARAGEFVDMFCSHMRLSEPAPWPDVNKTRSRAMTPADEVTRIEFRKVPNTEQVAVQQRLI